jgi:hypothetical protein
MRKALKWLSAGAFALLVTAAVALAALGWYMDSRYDARVAELRASGEVVDFPGLAPAPVPDARKAAILYKEAVGKLDGFDEGEAYGDLVEALNLGKPLTDAQTADARARVRKAAGALPLLRVAAAMPKCRFPLDYETSEPTAMLLPHLGEQRRFAQLLRLSARVNLADGRPDAAADEVAAIYGVGRSLDREPVLVSTLVRTAILSIAAEETQNLLDKAEPSEAALARLAAAMPAPGDRSPLTTAFVGERAMGLSIFGRIRRGEPLQADCGSEFRLFNNLPVVWFGRGWLMYDGQVYIDVIGEFVRLSKLPSHRSAEGLKALESRTRKDARWTHPLTSLLVPAPGRVNTMFDRGSARADAARTAIALRRHKLAAGSYPARLEDLPAALLPAGVPDDPFSGKGLRYKTDGKGFVVWSVGENTTDEGGRHGFEDADIAVTVRR